jgi:AraC-like DNA-binding protein
MNWLLARARFLTREPGLGYHLALHDRVSTYGHAGLAASSATTLKGAIELTIRYAALFSTALSLSLHIDGGQAFLVFDEEADLLGVRDIVLIHQMLRLEMLGRSLTGQRPLGRAEIAIPEPAYQGQFGHLVPHWRFGQPANRLVMDAALLEAPIVGADPGWHALACSLCEKALSELDFDLVHRVRRLVVLDAGGFRSPDDVAKEMHLSREALVRRLARQGVSFSTLIEQERREQALALLRSSRLSVDAIARRLGYASASTFVRAFRSWTGKTPNACRREEAAGPRE